MIHGFGRETFFEHIETDWSYFHPADQSQLARSKIQELFAHNVYFSDFGTRRRRSYRAQETFIRELSRAHFAELDKPGTAMSHASGTSNVHFARLYGLRPIGTVAHEWTMAVSALEPDTGLEHANYKALIKWAEMYAAPEFRIALSDTFGVDAFLRDFDAALATEYRGTRQDSGDPKVYVDKMVEHYRQLGIDYSDKFIVFSDALNVPRCIALKDYAIAKGIQARFGVGTNFTNDYSFHGDARASPTLNIVIKLHAVARKGGDPFIPVVKLSDEKDKYTGEKAAVKEALAIFGIKNGSE